MVVDCSKMSNNELQKTLHRNKGAFISRLRCKVMTILFQQQINWNYWNGIGIIGMELEWNWNGIGKRG